MNIIHMNISKWSFQDVNKYIPTTAKIVQQ